MGKVDRLQNTVFEPFAALFWALGNVLATNTIKHMTLPAGLVIVGSIRNDDAPPPPPFSI